MNNLKSTPFQLRIKDDLLERFRKASEKEGLGMAEIVRSLIADWLKEAEKNGK